jgi:hypothetical protein
MPTQLIAIIEAAPASFQKPIYLMARFTYEAQINNGVNPNDALQYTIEQVKARFYIQLGA